MRNLTKILILLLFLLNLSLSANTVGTITALSGSASIVRDGKSLDATLGAKLQQKDSIKTSDATKVQVIFSDETIISIGKNSNFSIEEFLFDESDAPSAKFGLLSGAMRTITGKIGKVAPDKFSVKTKTATIGIRGTNFSIFTGEDGSAKVFCTFGAISVTAQGDTTSSVVTQGFYIQVSPSGAKSAPIKFTPQELKEAKEESFASASSDDSSSNESQNEDSGSDSQEGDSSAPMADSPIDTSSSEDLGLVVVDITEATTNSAQTGTVDKAKKIVDDEIEAARVAAEKAAAEEAAKKAAETDPIDPIDPVDPVKYSLDGYTSPQMTLETKSVTVDVKDSTFNGAYVTGIDEIYTTSKTANSFISMDEFTSSIVSITSTHVTDIELESTGNYFNATPDDLATGDSMNWGEWGVSYSGTFNGDTQTYTYSGLWIAGEATPSSVIEDYHNNQMYATYNGRYKVQLNNTVDLVIGDVGLTVDFGQNRVDLIIQPDTELKIGTSTEITISGNINGNQMNGTDAYNNFNGKFYGTDAKSAGGTFYLDNSGVLVNGVYQVKTTEFAQGTHPDIIP